MPTIDLRGPEPWTNGEILCVVAFNVFVVVLVIVAGWLETRY